METRLKKINYYNTEVFSVSDEFTKNLRKTILNFLPTGRKLIGVNKAVKAYDHFDKYSELYNYLLI